MFLVNLIFEWYGYVMIFYAMLLHFFGLEVTLGKDT